MPRRLRKWPKRPIWRNSHRSRSSSRGRQGWLPQPRPAAGGRAGGSVSVSMPFFRIFKQKWKSSVAQTGDRDGEGGRLDGKSGPGHDKAPGERGLDGKFGSCHGKASGERGLVGARGVGQHSGKGRGSGGSGGGDRGDRPRAVMVFPYPDSTRLRHNEVARRSHHHFQARRRLCTGRRRISTRRTKLHRYLDWIQHVRVNHHDLLKENTSLGVGEAPEFSRKEPRQIGKTVGLGPLG